MTTGVFQFTWTKFWPLSLTAMLLGQLTRTGAVVSGVPTTGEEKINKLTCMFTTEAKQQGQKKLWLFGIQFLF